ncbi:cupin domain-containing protein [Desulfobulbus oralis]|uniref:Cupin n=1 Tax=Desulfobulbus oralis TaxID=1986146 RepID=A0A2L1GPD5_9BACT|nr:cupin domain-containing protein [Desulfobulbus oralis]AVD71484.1 cupin [Desulfobulbus oralis]
MREKAGVVFSIAEENAPVPGCTVSKEIAQTDDGYISYFSLAAGTDISAEIFPYHKLIFISSGNVEVYAADGKIWQLGHMDSLITPTGMPVGMRSAEDTVYAEISIRRPETMNKAVKAGEIFQLRELVPYQQGKIVNMDVLSNSKMKFVIMSFDAGTGLAEHAAPGEALIFALEGEGTIGYEGTEHTIRAGENFHFAKGGAHFVKAQKRFKMALLLTLE